MDASFPLTVNNVAPAFDAGPDVSLTLLQATAFSRVITFTDPGADTWSGTVHFHDGASVADH